MRILVTGATGFIGKNLVESLRKQRHDVICLVREESNKDDIIFLKKLGCRLYYGDITKKESLKDLRNIFDTVYHIAGSLGSFNVNDKVIYDTNVNGTRNILKICNGQKFIFCSSAGVHGPIINGNERSKINPTNIYEETKAEAEILVKNYKPHVIIRPEFVYGKYDRHVLELFKSIKKRRFHIIGKGNSLVHPTYIADLVCSLIKCLDNEINNEIFIVAGEKSITVKEFADSVSKILRTKTTKIKIPVYVAKLYAFIFEPASKMLGIRPVITKSGIDFFTKSRTFNTIKAKKSLGLRPEKLELGVENTIRWYRKNGLL